MVRSRRRCALHGRCSCSAVDACRSDCLPTLAAMHAHPSTVPQTAPSTSGAHRWLRKPSRFPLRPRPRRFRFGRAVGRRLRGEPNDCCLPLDSGSALARRLAGADPPARQGRMRRDCVLHSPQRSSQHCPIVRQTPPLIGRGVQCSASSVTSATSFMGGMGHRRTHTMHARTHTHAGLGTRVSPRAETEAMQVGTTAYSA